MQRRLYKSKPCSKMIINVISLKRRPDRRLSLVNHLEAMRCTYRFWDGHDDRSLLGFVNISNSHKKVVSEAKNKKWDRVLIAEDDLRFSHPDSLKIFESQMPQDFDMFFGMIYTGNIQDGRITYGFSGLQFYCVSKKFYDTFLSAPSNKHLDIWLGERCNDYDFYCCDPFICYGESGYSDNFKRQWVFEETKLPRNLYR